MKGHKSSSAILEQSVVYAEVIICNTDRELICSYYDSEYYDQELETGFSKLVSKIRLFKIW